MRKITKIIVHYTNSGDVPASTIRQWHLANGWADIGYHKVIRRDGSIELGRPESQPGAHTKRFNRESLGVVLTGSDRQSWYPATAQLRSLGNVIDDWQRKYGPATVYLHKDLNATSCPGRLELDDIPTDEEDQEMFAYQLDVVESETGYQITGAITGVVEGDKRGHVFVNARAPHDSVATIDVWGWTKTAKKKLGVLSLSNGHIDDLLITENIIKGPFAIQLIPSAGPVFVSATQWIK